MKEISWKIKGENLQYDINRGAAKISALSSGKIDKYEYLAGEEILLSDQRKVMEQVKFTYSPLGKALEKQKKTNWNKKASWRFRSFKTLDFNLKLKIKDVIPENTLGEKAKNELTKIKKIQNTVSKENLVYRANEHTYNFKSFERIHTFSRDVCNGEITLEEDDEDQSSLLVEIMNFPSKIKPQNLEKKQKKKGILKTLDAPFDGRERAFNAFGRKILPIKNEGTGFSLTIQISKFQVLNKCFKDYL